LSCFHHTNSPCRWQTGHPWAEGDDVVALHIVILFRFQDVGVGLAKGLVSEIHGVDHPCDHTLLNSLVKGMVMQEKIRVGIVTVSDRASRGEYEDRGGPAIREYLTEVLTSEWTGVCRVIADDQSQIQSTLCELCDQEGCCLVVTTGGTGPAARDVTPEATEAVCEKMMPGFGELMRKTSLEKVPTAILSRQTAGIRGNSLIVNLPGQPKAIRECLDAVFPAIPYCVDLIGGPYLETNPTRIVAFRPKK